MEDKGFEPVQLHEAKQAIRPGKEQEAKNRAQQVYGEKYNPPLMFDSKKKSSFSRARANVHVTVLRPQSVAFAISRCVSPKLLSRRSLCD